MSNICCFRLLKCDDLLLFFVVYDSKWRNLGFWLLVRQKFTLGSGKCVICHCYCYNLCYNVFQAHGANSANGIHHQESDGPQEVGISLHLNPVLMWWYCSCLSALRRGLFVFPGTTLIWAGELRLNRDVRRCILKKSSSDTSPATPEEHFSIQLKPKEQISISSEFMCVLQKAPISQSRRPLKVL